MSSWELTVDQFSLPCRISSCGWPWKNWRTHCQLYRHMLVVPPLWKMKSTGLYPCFDGDGLIYFYGDWVVLDAFCIAFCGNSAAKPAEFARPLKGKKKNGWPQKRWHGCLLPRYFALKAFVAQDVFLGNTKSRSPENHRKEIVHYLLEIGLIHWVSFLPWRKNSRIIWDNSIQCHLMAYKHIHSVDLGPPREWA